MAFDSGVSSRCPMYSSGGMTSATLLAVNTTWSAPLTDQCSVMRSPLTISFLLAANVSMRGSLGITITVCERDLLNHWGRSRDSQLSAFNWYVATFSLGVWVTIPEGPSIWPSYPSISRSVAKAETRHCKRTVSPARMMPVSGSIRK